MTQCLFCNEELKGRSDKRFCDSQCRSAYHNTTPNAAEAKIKTINKQLRKNRSALRTACPLGKATVRKEFLVKLGLDFNYFTHQWKSQSGTLYNFCYDYGYTQAIEAKKVLIIQWQYYMDKKLKPPPPPDDYN